MSFAVDDVVAKRRNPYLVFRGNITCVPYSAAEYEIRDCLYVCPFRGSVGCLRIFKKDPLSLCLHVIPKLGKMAYYVFRTHIT